MPVSLFERIVAAMSGRRTLERLADVERAVRKLGEAERDRSTVVEARLQEIGRVVAEQPTAKDFRELRQAMRAAVPESGPHQFTAIDQMAASGRPVVVGPWTGEVGFELLYWIPFVEWVRARWQIAPEREVIVSRGGVASWYGRGPDRYVDVLSLVSPDDFRTSVAEEKRKHRRPGAFDERVTEAVVRHRGLGEVDLLHPGLMFRAFAPYWSDEAGYALIDQFRRPRLLEPPAAAPQLSLPKDYVAVRFYFSECFPATPQNRLLARTVTASLAERSTVVLLNPGFAIDEHADWVPDSRDRIISIGEGLAPERNLAVQSAAIAGARAFVGTYGGYSYLAPLYKVPTVAFYSRPSFKLHHLHAAQRTFLQIGAPTVMPIETGQTGLVQAALGSLAIA